MEEQKHYFYQWWLTDILEINPEYTFKSNAMLRVYDYAFDHQPPSWRQAIIWTNVHLMLIET